MNIPQTKQLNSFEDFDPNSDFEKVLLIPLYLQNSMQSNLQDGVILYRRLLNIKDKKTLKVIFLSSVSLIDAVELSDHENYVLNSLPYYELTPENIQTAKSNIQDIIEKHEESEWPQFNNASENLLSGWAVKNKKNRLKSIIHKINPVFIEDEIEDWKIFYKLISSSSNYSLLNKSDIINELNSPDFVLSENFKKADFVVSDFYILESHNDAEWKDQDDFQNISGLKLYSKVSEKYPMIPWLMLTTSNKIYNYELMQEYGVDRWVVKDNRWNASIEDKLVNYKNFESAIQSLIKLKSLHKIYYMKYLPFKELLEKATSNDHTSLESYWWYSELYYYSDSILNFHFPNNQKLIRLPVSEQHNKMIYNTLFFTISSNIHNVFFALKRDFRRASILERKHKVNNLDRFTYRGVVTQLGRAIECLYRLNTFHVSLGESSPRRTNNIDGNDLGFYLSRIRNDSAHDAKALGYTLDKYGTKKPKNRVEVYESLCLFLNILMTLLISPDKSNISKTNEYIDLLKKEFPESK